MFTFIYRNLAAKQRRYRIGSYPQVTLAAARKKARSLAARVTLGEDPAQDRWKQKLAARGAMLFEELSRLYLRDHAKRHKAPTSLKKDERILEKDLLPPWKDRDIQTIGRSDVVKLLDAIVSRGSKVMANRTRALVGTIFTFARHRGYLPAEAVNPCQDVPLPGGKEKSRERVLSGEELKTLWRALEDFEEPQASLYRLMLLTGQRSGEVKAMRWDELDWQDNLWVIPAEKTKNRQEQRVPLSQAAQECLKRLQEESASNVWVFPLPDTRACCTS